MAAPPQPPPLTAFLHTPAITPIPPSQLLAASRTPSIVKTETPPTEAEIVSYTITIPSCSAWFSMDKIHETEQRLLPEFFSPNSTYRNPNSYKYIRDSIISKFRANPTKKLIFTDARKTLLGDAGSIRKIFDFLEDWGLINYIPGNKKMRDRREEELQSKFALERKEIEEEETKSTRTCTGCLSLCSLACFVTDKADITLCARCFVRSNYQKPGLSSSDFKRVDLSEGSRPDKWTDKETLHLLEAVLYYKEDWKKVAEYVASRSQKDCIARFVRLPFGEQFLGEGQNGNFDEDEENTEKRRRLSPLNDASNPIMAQVAFLSAIVGPRVSEAAARAGVAALSDYNNLNINLKDEEDKDELIKKAELEIEKEQKDIEQSLSQIIDVQMKEIKAKIERFEEMELLLEKEKLQIENIKKLVLIDQLALAQNKLKGKGENITWQKFKSVSDVIDKGTTILL